MALLRRNFTRVAVVQIDYHPAALFRGRSPLIDPLFDLHDPEAPLLADQPLPINFEERLRHLGERIRSVYCDAILAKVRGVLRFCRA